MLQLTHNSKKNASIIYLGLTCVQVCFGTPDICDWCTIIEYKVANHLVYLLWSEIKGHVEQPHFSIQMKDTSNKYSAESLQLSDNLAPPHSNSLLLAES